MERVNPDFVQKRMFLTNSVRCAGCLRFRLVKTNTSRSNLAPNSFKRNDDGQYSFVFKQPQTAGEFAQAEEAVVSCPTDSIGKDGD
jgi:hypothetical protein